MSQNPGTVAKAFVSGTETRVSWLVAAEIAMMSDGRSQSGLSCRLSISDSSPTATPPAIGVSAGQPW
jgi:hypothetical protein